MARPNLPEEASSKMALESGNPIAGASLDSLNSDDGGRYNDLLNTDVHTDALDLTRHGNAEGSDLFDSAPPDATAEKIKLEDSELVIAWDAMDDVVDLTQIKEENDEEPYDWNDMDESMIELSDSKESEVKEEHEEEPFQWKSISRGTIDIDSNTDDDGDLRILDQVTVNDVPIKTEPEEVEFLWQNTDNRVVDILDSDEERMLSKKPKLGQSPLDKPGAKRQRPKMDVAEMKRRQQIYAEKARSQHGHAPQGQHSSTDSSDESDKSGPDFEELKRAYKAKKKSHTDTLKDDVLFRKAQNAETERIKKRRREMAYGDSSSDEAEESDDGLFVSQERSAHRFSARQSSPTTDDDESDRIHKSKGKPTSKKSKPDKGNHQDEQAEKRCRAKERKSELFYNRTAGIEAIVLRDQLKEHEAGEFQDGTKFSRRKKGADLSTKRTKAGRVSNITSLMKSNVYDDSNANLHKAALPMATGKKRKEFLASLIADIPLKDQKQANSDRIDLDNAAKILWLRNVHPDGKGGWKMKGMKSSLYHYQVQGAARMKMRETGEQAPNGGILADDMGLGKTVMTIATILANQQWDSERPKCTLIVCSPSLMKQWEREFEKHVEADYLPVISRHYGGNKFSGKGAEKVMERSDVILTTYGEVIRSYPKCQVPEEIKGPVKKEEWWTKKWEDGRDLLHRALFYRVVLDEAQAIKTHTSQTSIACRALMAKHRWAISGTPIQNRLEELFPYFKFLRLRHTGSMAVFRRNFCLEDNDVCNARLVSIIGALMIRRVHADMLMGAPLFKLPENHQETISLKFNKVEREIYDAVRARYVRAVNAAGRQGPEEQKKMVMVGLQRLRQMVSHIFQVQEVLEKEYDIHSVKAMWKDLAIDSNNEEDLERAMVINFESMIRYKGEVADGAQGEAFSDNATKQAKTSRRGKRTSTLAQRFGGFLRDLKKIKNWPLYRQRAVCQSCGQPPKNAYVTSCYHVYCKDCLMSQACQASERDQDKTPCIKCGHDYEETAACSGLKDLDLKDLSATVFQGIKHTPVAKPKFHLTMDYVDCDDELVLSTKLIAVKRQLKAWMESNPERKIIVFTEWLMVGHLLGRVCQQEGWLSCHYNGRMSQDARDQSLSVFQDEPKMKIMIASLKCGGTGLNLTAACRVICVDLWFNSCVEQQAFCRVHRIGQIHDTYITRFKVEDSVDDRLLAVQERKKQLISAAIDNKTVLSQLSLGELMDLFGPVSYKDGKPFILVDDEAGM